jgi:hypothetical protein
VERLQLTWLVWAVALVTVLNSQRWITDNGPILLLLTALLIGVYAGLVFLLGPATGDSALAVAGATLAVAALFQPARRCIQAVVDQTMEPGSVSLWLRAQPTRQAVS